MTGIDPGTWRERLARLAERAGPAVTGVIAVQCAMEWLRPEARELRDEIDTALLSVLLARDDLVVDRIVLHSLPVLDDLPRGEQAALNAAHADWMYRLAATAAFLPAARRPSVHRLIVGGGQRSVDLVDGMELRENGTWSDRGAAANALGALGRGAATPLTSYDIEMDGPFGDSDPSVYL
jgi:hypothetical protein